jgi:hypothetical protein
MVAAGITHTHRHGHSCRPHALDELGNPGPRDLDDLSGRVGFSSMRATLTWVLAGILALEIGIAVLASRSDAELRFDVENAKPRESVAAVFQLTNRSESPNQQLTQQLLASENVLLQDWAMTSNYTRRPFDARLQQAHPDKSQIQQFFLDFRLNMNTRRTWISLARLEEVLEGR